MKATVVTAPRNPRTPWKVDPASIPQDPEARMHSPASIQHLIGEQDGLIWAAVEAVALSGVLSVTFYVLTTSIFLT
jgi:hypothetical protein